MVGKYLFLASLLAVGTSYGMKNTQKESSKRIFYLIANPRASLVEVLRMIGERGDLKVMHIPANWAYCHEHNYLDIVKGWYREDAPSTYKKAKEDILKEAEQSDLFVGENTHTAVEFLEQNPEFMKDPRVQFIFLVREPHGSLISYYRKKVDYFDKLPKDQLSKSMGFKGLYSLYEKIVSGGGTVPIIIKTDDLSLNAEDAVKTLCHQLKIPFMKDSLHWKDKSENFSSFEKWGWYTIELTQCSLDWHSNAIKSTGFSKLSSFAIDEEGSPTFEEVENPKHREVCMRAYKENSEYYERLLKELNS